MNHALHTIQKNRTFSFIDYPTNVLVIIKVCPTFWCPGSELCIEVECIIYRVDDWFEWRCSFALE